MSMQSDDINEIATALAKAQGAMQNAVMNRVNPHFRSKYADLSSVLDAIRTPLSANGLAIVQTMKQTDGGLMLRTTLMHSSGQFIATEYPLPNTQKAHEMGSALTYARRYSISSLICNSADEDDDGNIAMSSKTNGTSNVVDEAKVDEIVDLLGGDPKQIAALCKHLGIPNLEAMTLVTYATAKNAINARAAKAKQGIEQ